MKKILVLYRELAGYFVASLNHLCSVHGVQADVVAYPVNKDAPFSFSFAEGITVTPKDQADLQNLKEKLNQGHYDLIFCGGWSDPDYMNLVKQSPKVTSLLGFDKQWLGTMRDVAAIIYLRLTATCHFDFAFVPGHEQKQFARRMGFRSDQIVEGAYACDEEVFESVFAAKQTNARTPRPRQIWFAGRYVQEKSVLEMFQYTAELLNGALADWELHCIGTGPLWNQRLIHPRIIHHGFVQPSEMQALIQMGEVFIMPSRYEPWAISVHEFATSGFALLLSDRIGSRFSFLKAGKNGLVFPYRDWKVFQSQLTTLCRLNSQELARMGTVSHELAIKVNRESWSQSLIAMMKRR